MHSDYLNPAIQQLRDQQVRCMSCEKQIEQADAAEQLLTELDPQRTYTCKYVCHRVTRNGYASDPDLKFTGEEARHDLRLFVEDLSEAARVPASTVAQRVLTVAELARKFRVSPKTVSRWRRRGLVSRRFLFDGRQQIGFLQSSVDCFVAENAERVDRGARFSQMTEQQRKQIVERARRLVQEGICLAKVIQRISQATGRSRETIRYTLKRFDEKHSDTPILRRRGGPLSAEAKNAIFQRHRRGDSMETLTCRFCQSRTSVNRILNEIRAAEIMKLPLDYINNEQFTDLQSEKVEAEILGPPPENAVAAKTPRLPGGLPSYLASLYETPLLTREQELHLFRKMNYLKCKASALRAELDVNRPNRKLMNRIEKLHDESSATKNQITCANLRLVASIAKRYIGPTRDFFELVSDGNISLLKAAEKFDFARGNRFSTYASWAIMKNFARTIPAAMRHQDRFSTAYAEMLGSVECQRADHCEQESAQAQRESQVEGLLSRLDDRERQIVTNRFGLNHGQEPLTLKQVGAAIGVTKERIRQIQFRVMSKLRRAAEEDHIEAPG